MLLDLANGTNSLTTDVVDVLDDPKTDPLLQLYGPLVALCAPERSGSLTSSNEPSREGASLSDHSWETRLRRWVGKPTLAGLPTDAISAAWALDKIYPQTPDPATWDKVPSRIEAPPMFECAWRWAIRESISRPDALRGVTVVATARSAGGTSPWLCWRLAAAKARFVPAAKDVGDLPDLIFQVANKVNSFIDSDDFRRPYREGSRRLVLKSKRPPFTQCNSLCRRQKRFRLVP